jgi:hypothetical protein
MERDRNGRALAKYGKCGTCGKRVSALADEDFECCEEVSAYKIEEFQKLEPAMRLVIATNYKKVSFSARDLILAMIGVGWADIDSLRSNLRSVGMDSVMLITKEDLVSILEDMELEEFVEVYWDTERVRRIEAE